MDYSDATLDVVNTYDRMGRPLTSATLLPGNAEHQLGITYAYSPATNALTTETWQGLVTDTLTRSTDPLGRNAGFQTLGGMNLDYTYDATGRFAAITSVVATGTNVATYTNDALGRRTQRLDTGTAGFQPATNSFTYNVRSELESALFSPLGTPSTSSATYQYDPIGNRIQAVENSVQTDYVSNMLNQYTAINAASPSYDDDGNMLTTGSGWVLTWDGENRLLTASNATTVITNTYDPRSRRIRKQVSVYNSTSDLWLPTSDLRYFYDGWSLLHEHDVITGTPVTHYLWGLDLSGSLQGAGGVGGLLAEIRSGQAAASASDANGNITEYVNASTGDLSARYTYDGFGKTIATSGPSSASFTQRFSSKYLDAEIGWYYYGYRMYDPVTGRWPNRDPIGEIGGANFLAACNNQLIDGLDVLGLNPVLKHLAGRIFFYFLDVAKKKINDAFIRAHACNALLNYMSKNIGSEGTPAWCTGEENIPSDWPVAAEKPDLGKAATNCMLQYIEGKVLKDLPENVKDEDIRKLIEHLFGLGKDGWEKLIGESEIKTDVFMKAKCDKTTKVPKVTVFVSTSIVVKGQHLLLSQESIGSTIARIMKGSKHAAGCAHEEKTPVSFVSLLRPCRSSMLLCFSMQIKSP